MAENIGEGIKPPGSLNIFREGPNQTEEIRWGRFFRTNSFSSQ